MLEIALLNIIFILKRISIFLNLLFYTFTIIYLFNTSIPFLYTVCVISSLIVYILWNKDIYIRSLNPDKFKILSIGISLSMFAFLVYLYTIVLKMDDDYWILHSFGWHIPIMLSSAFLIEAFIKEKPLIENIEINL